MSSKKDDRVYLRHILECIHEVRCHSGGILERLEEYGTPWDATVRRLQIMAESTMRLSDACKAKSSGIAWHKIKGFRHVLVHDYLGEIDPAVIKGVIREYLPPLEAFCEQQLKELEEKP